MVAVSLIKIAGDLALMGSGPRVGIGELFLPELQKGSSIMPGKVNPVIPEVVLQVGAQVIGNDTAITIGGLQGQFELNVRIPLMARNLLQSIHLLSTTSRLFAEKCVDGIEPNLAGLEASAEGTLAVATALNPYIGYDKAAEIVKDASASGGTLREVAREHGVDEETLDKALDLRKIAAGSSALSSLDLTIDALSYDAVPRSAARVEEVGPFSLFVGTGPWPYYARPRLGLSHAFTADDVRAVRDRQRALSGAGDVRVGARDDAVAARGGSRRGPFGARGAADGARPRRVERARAAARDDPAPALRRRRRAGRGARGPGGGLRRRGHGGRARGPARARRRRVRRRARLRPRSGSGAA